jgi:hypothetical protein
MSLAAAHETTLARRACQLCNGRRARFRYAGEVRADGDDPSTGTVLCFECYRSERDRRRAQLPLDLGDLPFLRPTGERRLPEVGLSEVALSEVKRAHRRRMLAHLDSTRSANRGWGR